MAVVPDETMPSTLPPEAIETALAEAHSIWVLADGTITARPEGQTRVVAVLLPLVIDGQVIGLLTAEAGQAGRAGSFNQISLDLLAVLAGQLAMMLENVQLFQQTEALRSFNEDIIQNMSNGLIAIDRDSCITAFNPAASHMLGYEAEEVLYQPLPHLIQSADLEKILKETLTSGHACAHQEITIRHADGAALAVAVSAAPLGPTDVAEPVGVVAVLEDLSEVKALEAERRRLDRLAALGEMSAVVAHEIRNPVAGIAAGVDYLTRNVPKDSPEFEGVQMIRGEIQRVNRILEDILFVARPARLKLSNEDLAQVIENVIQRCQAQIKESHVTVSTKFAKNLPLLQIDRQRLEQVFTNLVLNATQAMSNGGQLLLQTEIRRPRNGPKPGEVVVTIADTGPGIPIEAQHRIFEPFFTTKTRGTGLGLTVARRIIEEHGGSIKVDSEIAQGTRFTIKLPLTQEAAA
jgi:two-component system sensor histidine kinase AtoS